MSFVVLVGLTFSEYWRMEDVVFFIDLQRGTRHNLGIRFFFLRVFLASISLMGFFKIGYLSCQFKFGSRHWFIRSVMGQYNFSIV